MTERPTTLWLIVRRDVDWKSDSEASEPLELHPTKELAMEKARILKAEESGAHLSGRTFYVVEMPVIWPT
jgi:hypothetical protein